MNRRIRTFLICISSVLVLYIVVGGLFGRTDSSSDQTYRNLGVYSEVLSRIKSDYVTEPDLHKVTGGAIRGLLEALDPYSTYFTPQEYQEYLEHPDPGPASVGIFLSKRYGFATVVTVLPGSPAEKAGIKTGDLIDRVEAMPTREMSVVQIMRKLAGQPGTEVNLWVVGEARGEPQKVTVTRAVLNEPPPLARVVDDKTGYVRVVTFNQGKAAEIASKVKELSSGGADKLVLDLRNCAGGDVQEAVDTASLFLQSGLIAYTQGQRSPRQDITAKTNESAFTMPLVVLINHSTAGPAELVAVAMLGNKRAEVVGSPSFGIGVVQKAIPVGDGSGLLLSVAKYYGPDGKAIQDNGVTPSVLSPTGDETAAAEEEEVNPQGPEHFGENDDQQLRKAIEILKQKYAPAKAAETLRPYHQPAKAA
jgi:carboxyl-terminal processing protease